MIIITLLLFAIVICVAHGSSCASTPTCDQLYQTHWQEIYTISAVSAPWIDLVSLDNSGGTGDAEYSVTYTVGYSETSSISIDKQWSVEAGAEFSIFAVKGGYSETVTKMDSQTWSSSTSQSFGITVPAGNSVRFWQREIKFDLHSGKKVCTKPVAEIPYYDCVEARGHSLIYSASLLGTEAVCEVCDYNKPTDAQKLSFKTTCYSSQKEEKKRNEFCPIPGVDTPPKQLSKSLRGTKELKHNAYKNVTVSQRVGNIYEVSENGEITRVFSVEN